MTATIRYSKSAHILIIYLLQIPFFLLSYVKFQIKILFLYEKQSGSEE